jgi:hypothetical protein
LQEHEELQNLNLTDFDFDYQQRQATADSRFRNASSPVIISMILLSLATFIAAFVQVKFLGQR